MRSVRRYTEANTRHSSEVFVFVAVLSGSIEAVADVARVDGERSAQDLEHVLARQQSLPIWCVEHSRFYDRACEKHSSKAITALDAETSNWAKASKLRATSISAWQLIDVAFGGRERSCTSSAATWSPAEQEYLLLQPWINVLLRVFHSFCMHWRLQGCVINAAARDVPPRPIRSVHRESRLVKCVHSGRVHASRTFTIHCRWKFFSIFVSRRLCRVHCRLNASNMHLGNQGALFNAVRIMHSPDTFARDLVAFRFPWTHGLHLRENSVLFAIR